MIYTVKLWLNSKVIHLHIYIHTYIYIVFKIFLSITVYNGRLDLVLCAIEDFVVYPSYIH